MDIALTEYVVTIKPSLTWGDMQQIQTVLTGGAKIGAGGLTGYDATAITEAKYKLLEIAVVSVKKDDEAIPFTREWMNNLSVEDGNTLFDAVDGLSKKK